MLISSRKRFGIPLSAARPALSPAQSSGDATMYRSPRRPRSCRSDPRALLAWIMGGKTAATTSFTAAFDQCCRFRCQAFRAASYSGGRVGLGVHVAEVCTPIAGQPAGFWAYLSAPAATALWILHGTVRHRATRCPNGFRVRAAKRRAGMAADLPDRLATDGYPRIPAGRNVYGCQRQRHVFAGGRFWNELGLGANQ
jgi:hypothetical protein